MHLQCLPIKKLRVRGVRWRPFTEHGLYCSCLHYMALLWVFLHYKALLGVLWHSTSTLWCFPDNCFFFCLVYRLTCYTLSRKKNTIYWGESERAPHKQYSCAWIIYIYILLRYVGHAKYICPAWLYEHKCEIFYCAFSFLGHIGRMYAVLI